eukprot:CAMPEP_0172457754 /NCGR_PEP_ID=MMETSP1065-20121228/23992_1 /TAXON_ID=265537 /ORGANISM="Amphiprora paludosa, Strain CCMP125" /LENGTH=197 /DNA_ID=CAMNT_0013211665 /DNA_START=74 /DNA_END=667 /DNA_ORIENTATION=-
MTVVELSDKTCDLKELAQLVGKNGVTALRLTNVELAGSDDDMFGFATVVRGHPTIEEFKMIDVKIADPTTSLDNTVSCLLVSASCIHTLHLENTRVSATTISTATHCSTLKKLVLPKNGFTDADAGVVANSLSSNKSIETVDLSNNDLSDVGCKAFESCLDKNKALCVLKLEGNGGISGDEFTKIEAKLRGRTASAA